MSSFSQKIIKALCGVDLNSLNNELTRLKLENSRISELLKNTSREYNYLNEKYKKAKECITESDSKNENCQNEIVTLKGELNKTLQEKQATENELKATKDELQNYEESVKELKALSEELGNFIKAKEQEELNNANLEKQLSDKDIELEKALNEISSLNNELGNSVSEVSSLKNELEKALKEKKIAEDALCEAEDTIKEYEDSLSEFKSMSEKLGNIVSINDKSDVTADWENQISEKKQELEKASSEIAALKEELNKALQEKQLAEKELTATKDELQNYEESVKELKALSEEMGNFIKAKEQEELNNANLEKQLSDKDIELEKALNEISSLKSELNKTQQEKNTAEENLKVAKEELKEYESTVNELKAISEGLESFITQKENEEKKEDEEGKSETIVNTQTDKHVHLNEEKEKEKLNNEIVALTKEYAYVRVTTNIGNQYIYQSKHLQMKAGLFDWGIEGNEVITDEVLFLTHDNVAKMEGLNSPFDSEELICDLSNEESAQQLVESLLMAICTYQPIQINYHDKNGRTTTKTLYHISFQPSVSKFTLPYNNMFKDMLEESLDTDHISAMCPHNPEPRNFSIAQIETIRRYNAYFTTEEGINVMKEGIILAQKAEQQEMADILSSKLPN